MSAATPPVAPSAAQVSFEGGHFGAVEISAAERCVRVDGQPVALGSRAFDLLAALVARRDRVVPKDELIDVVWPGLVVEENNLQVQISALRKALGPQAIATVPGRGYRFTVAARPPQPAPGVQATAGAAGGMAMGVHGGTGGLSTGAELGTGLGASAGVDAEVRTGRQRSERAAAPMLGQATRASRLLVADDNKVNRLLLCRSLALMGLDVHSVEDGHAALARLRAEPFDLLLLDLEMPQLSGFDLLALRAAEPALRAVPVIVTSSLEGAAPVARCIELGADDFLHKPVNPVLLQARVASSLERKHLNDRQRELLARLAPGLPEALPQGLLLAGNASRGPATLLVARLQGLETMALGQGPHETLDQLSNWATLMLDAVEGHGGRVNHLGSDGLSAVFGLSGAALPTADAAQAIEASSAAALQAAREMVELAGLFNAELAAAGKAGTGVGISGGIGVGIGVASGDVVAGHAGTAQRAAHVCVGEAVRRAAGLAALAAEATGAPEVAVVWLDATTRAALGSAVHTLPGDAVALPGHAAPVAVHTLLPPA